MNNCPRECARCGCEFDPCDDEGFDSEYCSEECHNRLSEKSSLIEAAETLRAQLGTAQARIAELVARSDKTWERIDEVICGPLEVNREWETTEEALWSDAIRDAVTPIADIRRALAGEPLESEDETVAKVVRLVDIKKIWDKLGAPDEQ